MTRELFKLYMHLKNVKDIYAIGVLWILYANEKHQTPMQETIFKFYMHLKNSKHTCNKRP